MKKGILTLVAAALTAGAMAQFTPDRLVVAVVGDGTAPLTSASTVAKLQEYDLGGNPGFSVAFPIAVSGSNRALTNAGSATSEGFVGRSLDGRFLTYQGYDSAPGVAGIAATDSAVVNRVVARIDAAGNIDTTTAFNMAFVGSTTGSGNPRSSITIDGSHLWISGTSSPSGSGGVWYADLGGGNPVQVSGTPNNSRVLGNFGMDMYISSASAGFLGVNWFGGGFPTTSGFVATNVIPAGTGASSYDYYFADAATCYIADDRTLVNGGGIQKWTNGGTGWALAYTLNTGLTTGCRGLAATTIAGTTTLYATTTQLNANSIVTATDTGAGSMFTNVATAAVNTAFRGIRFAPESGQTTTTINPTTTTLAPGIVISGTPADMFTSDDMYYVLRPGVVLSSTQSPIVLVLSGTAPGNNPSDLKIMVESKANQANVRETIDVFNFVTMAYETVNQQVLTLSDVVKTLTIANPADHIGAGNEVRAKLSYKAVGPILSYPWRVSIDEATWRYTN